MDVALPLQVIGDTALVGASFDGDNGIYSGSAYIFRYNGTTWVEEQKLLPTDGAENDRFGESLSISGNTVLVGASNSDDNGNESGSAYVFRYNGTAWVEKQKILLSDGASADHFGYVSLSGDTALIGAPDNDHNGTDAGSAHFYDLRKYKTPSIIGSNLTLSPDPAPAMDITGGISPGATVSFTLTNYGTTKSAPVTGAILGGANPGNFEIVTDCISPYISPYATCTIQVRPIATGNGTYSATFF